MVKKTLFLILILSHIFVYAQIEPSFVDERGFVVKMGQQAPDFKINYANGKTSVQLSDLKG